VYESRIGNLDGNGRRDMPLDSTASFDDAYEITGPIVLLFLLKDEIFLFAIYVQALRVYRKHKHGTNAC